jgi:hypothetical protein
VDEPQESGEMTVMTAAMVQKYCAMEEMNGRINPAMSDSDEDSNGKVGQLKGGLNNPGGKQGRSTSISGGSGGGGHMKPNNSSGRNSSISGPPSSQRQVTQQPDSEDESDRRTPIKNVKQYQTKL